MTDYQVLEDQELLVRIAAGDKDALEAIYERYSSAVYSLARYMLRSEAVAEEATQDVFLNIWLKAASYSSSRGQPKTWIMSVAHHKVIDVIRSRRRAAAISDPKEYETLDLLPSGEVATDVAVERNLEAERVREALSKLPAAQQEVINLAYFNGLSQSEIAARLGQPLGTVKTRARLALQKLREELRQDDDE
ncbi:MAG: sigma-70 family RNA polymerase sigma factor [Chloroflexota bacterium]|nr:sigma-70 family RNA polymerase sigma factor [Chloroflexota bacterium]MDE2841987.1 sigma-70 family RNA polymerase sigma factor [Chloroflexota bacterium]